MSLYAIRVFQLSRLFFKECFEINCYAAREQNEKNSVFRRLITK